MSLIFQRRFGLLVRHVRHLTGKAARHAGSRGYDGSGGLPPVRFPDRIDAERALARLRGPSAVSEGGKESEWARRWREVFVPATSGVATRWEGSAGSATLGADATDTSERRGGFSSERSDPTGEEK